MNNTIRTWMNAGLTVLLGAALVAATMIPIAHADSKSYAAQDTHEFPMNKYGAHMPYTRYEAEDARFVGGVTRKYDASMDPESTEVEASYQQYIEMENAGDGISFVTQKEANAIDVRFTLPDTADGQGKTGLLRVNVNGEDFGTLSISSHFMWQYMEGTTVYDTQNAQASRKARFRFDEVRQLYNGKIIPAGAVVTITKANDDNVKYGIDFVELEKAENQISQPDNSLNVTDFGAQADDFNDDFAAFDAAIYAASTQHKTLYIPRGQFNLSKRLYVNTAGLHIVGAGQWWTHLNFTSSQPEQGGFLLGADTSDFHASDFYMDSNLTSRYNEKAGYKAFQGVFGQDSSVERIWEQHFECGVWATSDTGSDGTVKYNTNLSISHSRIRNNLADGVNFTNGTSYSSVTQSNIRGNGDDGLAIWPNNIGGARNAVHDTLSFNTIENGWRAGGIGIFGGDAHTIDHNLVKDTFAGAGLRFNTVFDGYQFTQNNAINVTNNYLLTTGTTADLSEKNRGAIDFETLNQEIRNINLEGNRIENSMQSAVNFTYLSQEKSISGIHFAHTEFVSGGIARSSVLVTSRANNVSADFDNSIYTRVEGEHKDSTVTGIHID
ncbi:glycosyl hydrolase family 28-related protein [Alloscardovia venturai]|uniref:Glycosyl hydrolase family 28-related protein n=1 Tax=Alloscardovia venturai TaxID=1769421 RepID=A0ABW2Y4H0_9BIFI